nr:hypothetical protein [Tanacetum cinerariifolium]
MVPRAVLMKSGLVSVNTARQVNAAHSETTVNAARPMTYYSKIAHATVKRPIHKNTTFKNSNVNQRGNLQKDLQDQRVIDSGCSRHMTGNMSYLIDYEEMDGGYVDFGGNPKGGKIIGKCTIKTGNLDFENVYFVRELKFNLFSVSQIVPRKNNMYSVDLKDIVPKGDLTCLFAKATSDESKLWCPVTILNTIDHLGKFDGKADEGFFVGYSLNSKAFRVFNSRTRIVEENLHIRFSENTPNVVGSGPDWLFDIDALSRTMNYEPIVEGTQSNDYAGTKSSDNAGQAINETESSSHDDRSKPSCDNGKKVDKDPRNENECKDQEKEDNVNSLTYNAAGINEDNELLFDLYIPALKDVSIFNILSNDEDDGVVADMNNLDTTIQVSPIPTTRIHKVHPLDQVTGDLQSATQTRKMSKNLEEHMFGRIEVIDADEDITLVNDQDDADKDMIDVNILGGEEVFAAVGQNDNVVNITTEELTLAQALEALKTSKPKVKGIVIQEQEEPGKSITTIATIPKQQSRDKGKAIMIEEPMKPKKKDQIRLDKEAGKRLQTIVGRKERKRAGEELIQKSTKKQKVEDDKETIEFKQLMKIIPDKEEVAINAIPLAVKSPRIID